MTTFYRPNATLGEDHQDIMRMAAKTARERREFGQRELPMLMTALRDYAKDMVALPNALRTLHGSAIGHGIDALNAELADAYADKWQALCRRHARMQDKRAAVRALAEHIVTLASVERP